MPSRIAAQLYTLRNFTRTPAEIAQTFKKVKQIGYDAVQASALGPIEYTELAKILDGEGLVCCATHVGFEKMRDEPRQVIDEHAAIKCIYPAIGGLPEKYRSEQGYHQFAREFNEVGKVLRQGGLWIGYHNHSFELEKFGRKTALDILIEETEKEAVNFEIDTYWIQHGGGDPAAWIRKVSGRIPLVHLKDMVFGADTTAAAPAQFVGEPEEDYQNRAAAARAKKPIMAEVGEGNINFPAILDACRAAGTEWYIVEQDTCQRDPFESLAISIRNLREMGLQ